MINGGSPQNQKVQNPSESKGKIDTSTIIMVGIGIALLAFSIYASLRLDGISIYWFVGTLLGGGLLLGAGLVNSLGKRGQIISFVLLSLGMGGVTLFIYQHPETFARGWFWAALVLTVLLFFGAFGTGNELNEKSKPQPPAISSTLLPISQQFVIQQTPENQLTISPITQQQPVIEQTIEITRMSILDAGLKGDFDELARMLAVLDKKSDREYGVDPQDYQETCDLIKAIGKELNFKGGESLMREVLIQAGSLGCNTRFVEREWNGIGEWWG